jgi:hypothetical protein
VSDGTCDAASGDAVHALVKTATELGEVPGLIQAAGVTRSPASPSTTLQVDV